MPLGGAKRRPAYGAIEIGAYKWFPTRRNKIDNINDDLTTGKISLGCSSVRREFKELGEKKPVN